MSPSSKHNRFFHSLPGCQGLSSGTTSQTRKGNHGTEQKNRQAFIARFAPLSKDFLKYNRTTNRGRKKREKSRAYNAFFVWHASLFPLYSISSKLGFFYSLSWYTLPEPPFRKQ